MTSAALIDPAEKSARVARFVRVLTVDPIGADRFRGHPLDEPWPRVFGGLVLAQALAAAGETAPPGMLAHAQHATFLRAGSSSHPIEYAVSRMRDGRSFATRRVDAWQDGALLLTAMVSFQIQEAGLSHQMPMPDVRGPEGLRTENQVRLDEAILGGLDLATIPLVHRAMDFRPVQPRRYSDLKPETPTRQYWIKPFAPLPDDPRLLQCVVAYLSDMQVLNTVFLPHGVDWRYNAMQVASLNQVIWFHEIARFSDWMLWDLASPWTGHARGIGEARLYDRAGTLMASVAQEGLMRSLAS